MRLWVITGLSAMLLGCDMAGSKQGPFADGRVLGINKNHQLEETSGLAASRRHRGMLWSHNDGGHPAELFLLDTTGQTVASWQVAGARNRDWEDIAMGPGPDDIPLLFIGDVGDNRARHPTKRIYCVAEPELAFHGELSVKDTLVFRLADGARDMETLMVDPKTRNIYLISKMEKEVHVYEITYPYETGTFEVSPALRIPERFITAGDISPDGSEILLKSYSAIYYWKRLPGQSVIDALKQEPVELSYSQEPQGEAIAWASSGRGFYTLSENGKGERGWLIYYERLTLQDTTSGKP